MYIIYSFLFFFFFLFSVSPSFLVGGSNIQVKFIMVLEQNLYITKWSCRPEEFRLKTFNALETWVQINTLSNLTKNNSNLFRALKSGMMTMGWDFFLVIETRKYSTTQTMCSMNRTSRGIKIRESRKWIKVRITLSRKHNRITWNSYLYNLNWRNMKKKYKLWRVNDEVNLRK